MQKQRVVAVHRFQSKPMKPNRTVFLAVCFALLSILASSPSFAQLVQSASPVIMDAKYIAKLELHSKQALTDALHRAQNFSKASINEKQSLNPLAKPIAFILHGEDAKTLLSKSASSTEIFQLAEMLSKENVIDIQICETWMRHKGVKETQVPSFISTIRHAPTEEKRLVRDGYTYF